MPCGGAGLLEQRVLDSRTAQLIRFNFDSVLLRETPSVLDGGD